MSRIKFLNINVDNVTMLEAIKKIEYVVRKNANSYIVTPNLDHIIIVEKDEYFKEIYKNANLILTDGQPLIWISKLLGNPIVEKVSGSDLFPEICKMASNNNFSIFILGAAEGVATKAAENLKLKYDKLNIVGTYSPTYGFENKKEEIDNIIHCINVSKPDILAVSLGSPKGEKFIYKYRNQLSVPLSMSIGATIDFEAGNIKRAPRWISKCGFEWLYRTLKEPKRLAKRYWNDAWEIIPIILKYRK